MSEYDTGLDEIPPPITAFDDGLGDADSCFEDPDDGRMLTSVTEDRLAEAGILHPHVGLETVGRGAWKDHYRAVSDTALFEYLVGDSVRAHVAFYREFFGYDDIDAFLTAAENGELMDSPSNVAETWMWIRDLDPPTSPDIVRRRSPLWDDGSTTTKERSSPDVPDIDDTTQGTLTSF
jgi:hypothetical protein